MRKRDIGENLVVVCPGGVAEVCSGVTRVEFRKEKSS